MIMHRAIYVGNSVTLRCVMSKQAIIIIVHRRTVGDGQLHGMTEPLDKCVMYLKCISLFISRGVLLATFKMYLLIIIWWHLLG